MLKKLLLYALSAVVGGTAAFLLSGFFMITEVKGSGMEPVLHQGGYVLLDRAAARGTGERIDTGDVIAVRNHIYSEDGDGSILIRRVAGRSGDSVEIKDDTLYINDKPYTEYMDEPVHMDDMQPRKLGSGQFFIMSDDRSSSLDSRNEAIGMIDIRECIGKVCFK